VKRLVAFEGGDGVGKATQSKILVDTLQRRVEKAVLYSFPRYDTMIGEAIRRHLLGDTMLCGRELVPEGALVSEVRVGPHADDALAFQCLMLADKYDAEPEIENYLREGIFVVCDRWKASSFAYGASDGLPLDWLVRVHERLASAALTIFLKVPEEVALARRLGLRDRYEKDRAKQVAVAECYEALAAANQSWVTVDGSGTVDEVAAMVWGHMVKRFFS
jgi:dTMP kinase